MAKKTSLIVLIVIVSAILAVLFCLVAVRLLQKNNNPAPSNTNTSDNNAISNSQNGGILGSHKCLSQLRVVRGGEEYKGGPEILKLDFFQSFSSGAFFGKIENFEPGQNEQFAAFINQLMQEQKINTYLHLRADVCLYYQDLLNPENGARLNYYVEHYYCTNHCQTGKYEIQVDLDADGNFIGYRKSDNIY